MDRGDSVASPACQSLLGNETKINVRQTRKGWLQECLGCEASTEFKFFHQNGEQFASALEDSNCLCRICFSAIHPFAMPVKDTSGSELFTVERPCACAVAPCKCCCYQTLTITSGGNLIGTISETFYCCVPMFNVTDKSGNKVYKIHQPTCCGGMCVNCCTNDSGRCCGICTTPFWVFDANQANTNGGDAEHLGSVVKKMKSLATEIFTDANQFDVTFPPAATVEQKAILAGSAIFINALFFETKEEGSGG